MKKFTAIISVILCLCMLVACGNTGNETPNTPDTNETALKTGLALVATANESFNATADKNGEGKYDLTFVAVLVDDEGVICDCIIDGIATSIKFDANGVITSDLTGFVKTKNELGADYGMVAWGGAIAEWDAQAAALAKFAIGKTVADFKNGAIDETGKAPAGSDLASSATIYLGGYVSAIEKAVANAEHLGAKSGDTLKLAAISARDDSANATAEKAGTTSLETTVTALTLNNGVITSCAFDAVQANVSFDATGVVTSDVTAAFKTKNELGADYGMVAWGGAIAEWDAQAAAFAKYVTGKTAAEVSGIAVNENKVPTDADLTSSVTIGIAEFKALVAKAAK